MNSYISKIKFIVCIVISITVGTLSPHVSIAKSDKGFIIDMNGGTLEKLAEGENIILLFNGQDHSIFVFDKRNDFLWTSSVQDDYYDMDKVNTLWQTNMKSLFLLSYTDFKEILSINSSDSKVGVVKKPIEDGVELKYSFSDLDISFDVLIWLENDSIVVKIPNDSVREDGLYKIVTIEILQYLGASKDGEKGYVFYPDGSGALSYFKDKPSVHMVKHTWQVYGTDQVDMDKYMDNTNRNIMNLMLPVFGVKRDENAFIGIFTGGEQDCQVNYSPSNVSISLNKINGEFIYRRKYEQLLPDMKTTIMVEPERSTSDFSINYIFLQGNNGERSGDYSGMANACRDYLLTSGKLKKSNIGTVNMPIWIELFMGIKEKRLLFDRYTVATTFEEARVILEYLKAAGVKNINVNLLGWSKDGYGAFPVQLPVPGALGGTKGLKNLSGYVAENQIKLFLNTNYVYASNKYGGFSRGNDTVYRRSRIAVTDKLNEWFLLNPEAAWKRFVSKIMPFMVKLDISGLSFDKFGQVLYHDYNEKNPMTRLDTIVKWGGFLDESAEKLGFTACQGGNGYVLKNTDILTDIPTEDSGFFFTDEAVPFYQMVVHGSIPYVSEPGNLFYDSAREKLKWIEYGYIPYYKLAGQRSSVLKYTEYNNLFSCYYKEWIENIGDIYGEFNLRHVETLNSFMIGHKKIENGVYGTEYSNGYRVLVNYNDHPVHIGRTLINPTDYVIVDREGTGK